MRHLRLSTLRAHLALLVLVVVLPAYGFMIYPNLQERQILASRVLV